MDRKIYQNMPESERKCVWMTSGIISYKLCPLNYACEECMFDRVMRNETAAMIRRPDVDAALESDLASIDSSSSLIDGSLFYHKSHCWVKVISPDEVKIGINGILARLIYGIKTVVLPKAGEALSRDQFFAHIIQEKHIVPLVFPISGAILSINTELLKSPDILRSDYRDKGWIVSVKPDNLENDLRTLVFGNSAIEWYRNKDRSVSEAIHAVYSVNGSDLGPTMQDGGELILNPSEMLTPDQYYKILEVLTRTD
jgi:glycine cleavage system H protein